MKDESRNISPIAIWLGGEELHNNHHADPKSARFAARWFEFDIGWVYIRMLQFLRLAKVDYAAGTNACARLDGLEDRGQRLPLTPFVSASLPQPRPGRVPYGMNCRRCAYARAARLDFGTTRSRHAEITCSRCGLTKAGVRAPPFPGRDRPAHRRAICQDCWGLWLRQQTMLINHYGLNVMDPQARSFLKTEHAGVPLQVGRRRGRRHVEEGDDSVVSLVARLSTAQPRASRRVLSSPRARPCLARSTGTAASAPRVRRQRLGRLRDGDPVAARRSGAARLAAAIRRLHADVERRLDPRRRS